MIVPSDAIFAAANSTALKQYKDNGSLVIELLEDPDLSAQVKIVGAKKIIATLRSIPGNLKRPIVVHLLNRD